MAEEHQYDRRRTDPLIIEMHGLLKAHIAHYEEHVKADEMAHKRMDATDERLKPLEDGYKLLKIIGWIVAAAGTPVVAGLGWAIWSRIQQIPLQQLQMHP